MEKFKTFTGRVLPLPMKDVDTDLIIPAKYLTTVSKEGLAQGLFRNLRDSNPDFPLNNPKYQGAEILVADTNFGSGSSREHAVWAIKSHGFKVVIAKSFADIFYNNSAKNGLLLVKLPENVVDQILEVAISGSYSLTVDLEKQEVNLPTEEKYNFQYDSFSRHCLLNGLDELDYLISNKEKITAFQKAQEKNRFYTTLKANQ